MTRQCVKPKLIKQHVAAEVMRLNLKGLKSPKENNPGQAT